MQASTGSSAFKLSAGVLRLPAGCWAGPGEARQTLHAAATRAQLVYYSSHEVMLASQRSWRQRRANQTGWSLQPSAAILRMNHA